MSKSRTKVYELPPQPQWKPIRDNAGKTRLQAAYASNTRPETIRAWELGHARPSPPRLELYTAFLADCERIAAAK